MIAWAGGLLVLLSSLTLYLASPNQRLTGRELPRRALGWSGLALFATGLALLLQWAGSATSVFIALTAAMLLWSVLPLAVAWRRGAQGGKS